MLVNKWVPIGRAPEDEDAEREKAKGFVVYGSDANFRARMELKMEEEASQRENAKFFVRDGLDTNFETDQGPIQSIMSTSSTRSDLVLVGGTASGFGMLRE